MLTRSLVAAASVVCSMSILACSSSSDGTGGNASPDTGMTGSTGGSGGSGSNVGGAAGSSTAGASSTNAGGSAAAGSGDSNGGSATAGASTCGPLAPTSVTTSFDPSSVLGAGKDTDGTLYVMTSIGDLYVGTSGSPLPQVSTIGGGSTGTLTLVDYLDANGDDVKVEVDTGGPNGTQMGVAKNVAGKTFTIGSVGDTLTILGDGDIAALSANTSRTYAVTDSGHTNDGRDIVVIGVASGPPVESDPAYGNRVFFGPASALAEGTIMYFGGSLSGYARQVVFTIGTTTWSASWPIGSGGSGQPFIGEVMGAMFDLTMDTTPAEPSGGVFVCAN